MPALRICSVNEQHPVLELGDMESDVGRYERRERCVGEELEPLEPGQRGDFVGVHRGSVVVLVDVNGEEVCIALDRLRPRFDGVAWGVENVHLDGVFAHAVHHVDYAPFSRHVEAGLCGYARHLFFKSLFPY